MSGVAELCLSCQAPSGATVFRRVSDGAWFDDDGHWRHADHGLPIGDQADPAINPHYLESVGRAIAEHVAVVRGLCLSCRGRRTRAARKSGRALGSVQRREPMKFRKKPIVIDAVQFDWVDGQGIPHIPGVKFREWRLFDVGGGLKKDSPVVETAYVETLEGPLHVSRGDWIITGAIGEQYPCKPDIFAKTYEAVSADG